MLVIARRDVRRKSGPYINHGKVNALSPTLINRLFRYPVSIKSRLRVFLYRQLGAQIHRRARLHKIHIPRNFWDIDIGAHTYIDDYTVLLTSGDRRDAPRIIIGTYCGFNRYSIIDASERIHIGHDVRVGPHCYITDHDHGTALGEKIHAQPLISAPVEIADDVWIGAGATILKGVMLGRGAVVAAGAVVNRDVAPEMVVGGIPAKVIGQRK